MLAVHCWQIKISSRQGLTLFCSLKFSEPLDLFFFFFSFSFFTALTLQTCRFLWICLWNCAREETLKVYTNLHALERLKVCIFSPSCFELVLIYLWYFIRYCVCVHLMIAGWFFDQTALKQRWKLCWRPETYSSDWYACIAGFTGIDDPYEPPLNCEVCWQHFIIYTWECMK